MGMLHAEGKLVVYRWNCSILGNAEYAHFR